MKLANTRQQQVLDFLSMVHGDDYTMKSCLDTHPLASELDIRPGEIVVHFRDPTIIMAKDGDFYFSPYPKGKL